MRNNPNVRPRLFTKVAFLLTATLALSAVAVPAAAEPVGCESDRPAIAGPMSVYLIEGQPVADHSFSTGCAEPTTWAVAGDLPPGLTFDATTARFTGTPTTDAGGSFEITATDSRGTGLFEGSFEVVNPDLMLSGPEGSPIDLTDLDRGSALEVNGFAPDGATVDVLWSGVSLGANPAAGSFARELTVPADAAPGIHSVGVTIGFGNGQSYSFGFEVSVLVLELTGPLSAFPIVGNEVTYRYSALGAGADTAYVLTGELPPGMAFDSSAVTISGTPERVGTYNLSLSVGDGARTDMVDVTIEVVAAAAVRPPIRIDPPSSFFQRPGMLGQIGGLDPDDAGSVGELDELIDRHNSAVGNSSGTPRLLTGVDPQTGEPRFFVGSGAESAREQNRVLANEAARQAELAKQEQLKALELERQKRLEAERLAWELQQAKLDERKKELQDRLEQQKRANEEAAEAARKRAEEEYLKKLSSEAAQRMLEQRQAVLAGRTEPNPLPVGTKVRLELHSTPVLLGQATVGPSGGYLIRASVPTGTPPGLHHLVVTYTLPDGTVYTQALAVNVFDPNLLAPTGADVAPLGYAASAFLLVGLAAILVRRRLST